MTQGEAAAIMAHPSFRTIDDGGCSAVTRYDVAFTGKAAHAADGKRTASIDDSDDRGYAAGFDAGFEAGYKAARADDYIAPHADGKWER